MTAHTDPHSDSSSDNRDPTSRLSRRTLEQLAKADAWDTDRLEQATLSMRRAWLAALVGALIGVIGIAAAAWSHRTPPPPPMAVLVDRSTGQAQVISRVTEADVPALAVLDQHNAAQYVRSREGYFPALLQRDYDAVARMSTPVAFKAYGDRFVGEKAQHKQLGMSQEHRVAIVSARPVRFPLSSTASAAAGAGISSGEMVVTFDKEVRSNHSPQPVLTRHVATIQYEYRPSAMSKELDRIENPFGFVVTAYRVDAELATPAPSAPTTPTTPTSPAAAAQTAQTTGAKS